MADTNDIEVRFGADTSELDGASRQAVDDINQVSTASKNAATGTNALSQAQATAARQTQQMAAGHKQAAEATRTVADESVKLDQALTKLMSSLDASYKNAVKLAEGEELLHQNLAAGNISGTQHDAMLQTLRRSYGQAEQGAFNFGMSTSHAINGVRALTDELASGRTRQAGGTFTRLFLEFAAANPEVAALTAAILAMGGAFVVGAVHAEELDRAVNGIQAALTATGRAGDLSRQQIEDYINTLSRAPNVSRDAAEEIIADFSRMPQISAPIFDQLQSMVSDFATATGQKAPAAAKELAAAMEDPIKGAAKLDKQLNFLTSTQILAIQKAMEHGDTMKAQQTIIDALNGRIKGLTDEAMTPLQKAENDVSTAWKNFMDALGHSSAIDVVRKAVVGLLDTLTSAIQAMQQLMTLKGIMNASAAIGAQDAGMDASGYTSAALAAGQAAHSHQQVEATVNDELERQKRNYKDALLLAMQHSGKATERRKLEADINKLLAERKYAKSDDERKVFDDAISSDREKLANLNKPKKASHAGQATQMDQWRAQFEKMKADSIERTGQEDYQAEIGFWQKKLQVAKAGSKEYIEVENEINRLRISAARTGAREAKKADDEAFKAKIQGLKEQQAEAAGDLPKQIQIEQQILDAAKARYGDQSAAYKKFKEEMVKLDRQYQLQLANEGKAELTRVLQSYEAQLQVETVQMQEKLKLHQITQEQMTQFEIEQARKRLDAQEAVLGLEKQQFKDFPKQHQQVLTQIEQAENQHKIKMAQLSAQLVEQQRAMWTAAGNAAENAFSSSLQGILRGTTTFQSLVQNVALAVADSFIQSGVKMASQWIAQQVAMRGATAATTAAQTAADAARVPAAIASNIAIGTSAIATQAAVAAAAAFASTAAIPVTGPAMAPAAAAAAYGDTMSWMGALSVASAAGGWEVPRDQLMQVHEKEVVLPRAWAERFKAVTDNQAASNAGTRQPAMATAGGDNHLHIHATDAKSFERMLSDSSSHLHSMLHKWARNGKF